MNCISVILIALLGFQWFGKTAGFITSWMSALSFGLIILSGTVCAEVPAIFFMSLGFLLLDRPSWILKVLSGCCFGAAAMTRPELLLIALIITIFQCIQRRGIAKKAIIFLSGVILTISPLAIYNAYLVININEFGMVHLPYSPLSFNGPYNYYTGNGPGCYGGYRPVANDGNPTSHQLNFDPLNITHRKIFEHGYQLGCEFLNRNPGRIPELLINKVRYFSRGASLGFFHNNFPLSMRGSLRKGDIWVSQNKVIAWLLGISGSLCLILLWKKYTYPVLMIVSLLLLSLLAALVFFGLARNFLISLPFLYLLLGAGLVELKHQFTTLTYYAFRVSCVAFSAIIIWQIIVTSSAILSPVNIRNSSVLMSQARCFSRLDPEMTAMVYQKGLKQVENSDPLIIEEEHFSYDLSNFAAINYVIDEKQAMDLVNQALSWDPSNAYAYRVKGLIELSNLNTRANSFKSLDRYLEIFPSAPDRQVIKSLIKLYK